MCIRDSTTHAVHTHTHDARGTRSNNSGACIGMPVTRHATPQQTRAPSTCHEQPCKPRGRRRARTGWASADGRTDRRRQTQTDGRVIGFRLFASFLLQMGLAL
eukprot:4616125-Alexandrium_andersonii.AAC.1